MQMRELRSIYKAEPFDPFTMHLADGREVRVKHPDFIALSPVGRSVVVYDEEGAFDVIDLLLVVSVEVSDGKSRAPRKKR